MSFAQKVKQYIHGGGRVELESKTLSNALASGIYLILRKCSGYRLEHLFRDDFYSSQYFQLISFLQQELSPSKKMGKKDNDLGVLNKKSNFRRR